jgi:hypothetical protein
MNVAGGMSYAESINSIPFPSFLSISIRYMVSKLWFGLKLLFVVLVLDFDWVQSTLRVGSV